MRPPSFQLKSHEFRKERQTSWREVEKTVEIVERDGVGSLSPKLLTRLPAMHRSLVSSLSVARSISLDKNLLAYLESLSARSYFCIYGAKRRLRAVFGDFVLYRFPSVVRELRLQILLAALFMGLGGLVGFVQTSRSSENYYKYVPSQVASGRDPTSTTESLEEILYSGADSGSESLSTFASFLFTHNAQVGILAFALGIALGLPVFWLLFYNGLLLGAMSALYHERGLGADWWGWVLPHGVTELLAIVLCGAAGLVLAQGVLAPGRHRRMVNLAIQGRKAGGLVIGSVLLLLIAAGIEGFFRQLVQDIVVRYVVILITAVGWLLYFGFVGREAKRGEA